MMGETHDQANARIRAQIRERLGSIPLELAVRVMRERAGTHTEAR